MSFALTKEQQLIRQNARDFARQYLEPIKKRLDETGEYPAGTVRLMAGQDFLGLFLPAEVGGAEAGYLSHVLVLEELSRSCAAVASILNQTSLAAHAINRWGSVAQKERFLPLLASGAKLASFACREAELAEEHALIATPQGNSYILNGRIPYVANAGVAGLYVAVACTDSSAKGRTAFLIDGAVSGLSVGPAKRYMGLHGLPVADLVFENVTVNYDDVLGALNSAQEMVTETLAFAGVADAAQTLGISQAAVVEAAEYSKQRIQFGQPIANFEAIQSMLAEVATHTYLLRLAVYDAARLMDAGEPFLNEAAMVRWFAARVGPDALINTVQVEGGYGYVEEGPLARLYRDVWGTTIERIYAEFPEKLIAGSIR
jgi:alkylation response protein AidB-like acyl-CoA dehydrogenase